MSNLDDIINPTQLVEKSQEEEIASKLNNDHNYKHHAVDGNDHGANILKDVIMWRNKKYSGFVLLVATMFWILLQVYKFNFIPIASWMAIAVVTIMFSYGSYLRLVQQEMTNATRWEITEQKAEDIAKSTNITIDKCLRLMYSVSCEREWYIFVGVLLSLLLLSYVGRSFNMITLLYTGTLVCMTIPVTYVKKQDMIKGYVEKGELEGKKMYNKVKSNEKVFSKLDLKNKNIKQKKIK